MREMLAKSRRLAGVVGAGAINADKVQTLPPSWTMMGVVITLAKSRRMHVV